MTQPCEICSTKRIYKADLYAKSTPGSKVYMTHPWQRICGRCAKTEAGEDWKRKIAAFFEALVALGGVR